MSMNGIVEKSAGSFFSSEDIFILVHKPSAPDTEEKIVGELRMELLQKPPVSLSQLKERMVYLVRSNDTEADLSVAVGYIHKTILYVYTSGLGKVYLKRNATFSKIVEGASSASGYLKANDSIYFSIDELKSPDQEADELIVVKIETKKETESKELPSRENIEEPSSPKKFNMASIQSWRLQAFSLKRKQITYIAAAILLILFIWSVGFGIERRTNAQLQKEIESTKEQITAQLSEAADLATLNTTRSQLLVQQAKEELDGLKKKTNGKNEDVIALEKYILDKENQMFKRENKPYAEFYDLSLIENQAQGNAMSLDKDTLGIINSAKGKIYFISISKKSKDMTSGDQIKNSTLLSVSSDTAVGYKPGSGIYKATTAKVEDAIKSDSDWGKIVSLCLFNSNIYVLDSGKNAIYKYLVTDKGYSDKTSYLKGNGDDFSQANSLMIDSSLYVATTQTIYKYTSGLRDSFSLVIPHSFVIDKLFTNADQDKLYILDKKASTVYIINKDGQYERQIDSAILSQAADFVVSEEQKSLYVLAQNKIYSISLE